MGKYRYPGAQPFSSAQKDLFFGRAVDIQRLFELVSLEQLVVLYSKSGLGKSSLLNAGILPLVRAENTILPYTIRFGAFVEDNNGTPLETLSDQLNSDHPSSSYLQKLLPEDQSLWHSLKRIQASTAETNSYLLIFDQFEELFTYPLEHITGFVQQLKELLNKQIPHRFREVLEAQYANDQVQLSDRELEDLHQPIEVKVVMAIRSDRMSLLNNLKDYLPNILRHCYELEALSEEQAEDAILNPAYKKGGDFLAPPFDFEETALEQILEFLTKGRTQKIESFQLQILCQSIERKVIERKLKLIGIEDIGEIENIYKNYYDDQIARLASEADQLAARRFIEEGLIFEEEERRLSLYEGQIYRTFGISPKLLGELVDSHLLRAEPSMQGGYTYELSHDTLVAPVLMAKARRRDAELRKAIEQQREQQEALIVEERKKRRRATLLASLGFVLAAIAIVASVFAISFSRKALEKEKEAKEALDQFLNEKKAKETLEINRLIQNAETYARAFEYQLALDQLALARAIDSTNNVILEKEKLYQRLSKE